jgi:asparagine synthase (glutamine-hydrolysing)
MRRFLPKELLSDLAARPKRTFTFPLAQWMSQGLRPLLEEAFSSSRLAASGILEPDAVRALWRRYDDVPARVGWSRIWNLFVLVRWCEMMGVRP